MPTAECAAAPAHQLSLDDMGNLEHQVADLILEMEREMRALGLWETAAPPAAALRSIQPFSIDTLAFTQWLQWVFIPRIATMLKEGKRLPRDCAIAPLAETVFEELDADTVRLLKLVRLIDQHLSR